MSNDLKPMDEHNRALIANTRPADWRNPQPDGRYHLVVIGGGPAGLVAAAGASGLGAKVALIEKHLLGGDCLISGCVPSKLLLRSARAAADVRDGARFGIDGSGPLRFADVMERLRRVRAELSVHDSAQRFRDLGADVYLGEGRFVGPSAVEVGGQTLRFKKALIATGARASAPPISGLAEAGYLTNETVFALESLPARLAVIGAGAVGCELAQAFARFGTEVTLIEAASRILPREDASAAEVVETALKRDGVRIRAGLAIEGVARRGAEKEVRLAEETIVVDEVLVGAGRTPNVEGLGLEAAGVAWDRKGVQVDDRLRTANSRIYAAGDVSGRFPFTHAADAMARIVVRNALFLGSAKLSALTIPWCVYTDPEIAGVGLTEQAARDQGVEVQAFAHPLAKTDRAVLDGEEEGFVKVLVNSGTDRIVGAVIVARHAGEMIGELTLAMTARHGLKTLAQVISPYPTQSEAIRKIADAYSRTRLTPFVRSWMERWLRWTR